MIIERMTEGLAMYHYLFSANFPTLSDLR